MASKAENRGGVSLAAVLTSPLKLVSLIAGLCLLVVAGSFGFSAVRADVEAAVYRDRLETLAAEYDDLRGRYNDAVRRAVVTELIVDDAGLAVRVRTPEGVLKTVPTPFDPTREIFVDYVVLDGRVLIRRVFDADTPPSRGVLIDPGLEAVDWRTADARSDGGWIPVGKAVYRSLGPGRWVITVSGDGSLGLARAGDDDEPGEVVFAPRVEPFETLDDRIDRAMADVGWRDVVSLIFD